MSRWAAFLRGVNVGGARLKTAGVTAALTDTGFTAVRTVLASGSVLLDSPNGAVAVRATAEAYTHLGHGAEQVMLRIDEPR